MKKVHIMFWIKNSVIQWSCPQTHQNRNFRCQSPGVRILNVFRTVRYSQSATTCCCCIAPAVVQRTNSVGMAGRKCTGRWRLLAICARCTFDRSDPGSGPSSASCCPPTASGSTCRHRSTTGYDFRRRCCHRRTIWPTTRKVRRRSATTMSRCCGPNTDCRRTTRCPHTGTWAERSRCWKH